MSAEQDSKFIPADFDVAAWLERIKLGQYVALFADNGISGVALPLLTEEDLKACGVVVLGHRKVILHEIQKLVAEARGASAPSTPSSPSAATQPIPMPAPQPVAVPQAPQPAPFAATPTVIAPNHAPAGEVRTEIVIVESGVEACRGFIDPGEYVLGRDRGCDFVLKDALISRRHAKLTVGPGQLFIEDLGSSGGTTLDGFPVKERTNFLASQTIAIGPATIVLRRSQSPPPAAAPVPVPAPVAKPPPQVAETIAGTIAMGRTMTPPSAPRPRPKPAAPLPHAATVVAAAPTMVSAPRAGKPSVAAPAAPPEVHRGPQARQVARTRNVWTRQRVGFWAKIAASKFLIVSVGLHLLFGVGAAVYVVQRYQARRKLTFQGGPPLESVSKRVLEHRVSMAKKKNTMSAPVQAKRITTAGLSSVVLPQMPDLPAVADVVPKRMAGMGGMGTGPGFGSGGGMGTGLASATGTITLPRIVGDRCSAASRAAALKAGGGDPKSEESIGKGLAFLKSQQNPDGSFGSSYKNAMTGLALLAFLGHCEKPTSQEYGSTVRKAIDYLVKFGTENNGKLGRGDSNGWVYEHGIATYALGEAYIFTREEAIAPVLKLAVKKIIDGQSPDGGWVYGFTRAGDGDTSVTGWQIQALKVAHLSDLNIEGVEACMKKAVGQFMRVEGSKGGFGYRAKEDRWGLTGVGVFCLQIITHQKGLPVTNGLNFLQGNNAPAIKYNSPEANLYAWYYITQACFQAGGSNWGRWNRAFQPEVLGNQGPDGCWNPTGSTATGTENGGFHYTGTGMTADGKVYRTSLCILMLEVYYRYLASNQG